MTVMEVNTDIIAITYTMYCALADRTSWNTSENLCRDFQN